DAVAVPVIGLVQTGGRVVEGELGYRSAQARITELYDDGGDPSVAAVAGRFGVPVKRYPWPTATGMVQVHDRQGLPSMVRISTGDRTLTFFERPGSEVYETLTRVA